MAFHSHGSLSCLSSRGGLGAALTSMSKKVFRQIVKVALWLGAMLLVFAVAVVLINAFDEDLAPETLALLAAPPNPYPPETNLYLALAGVDAPPGTSTLAFGQAKIDDYEVKLQKGVKGFMQHQEAPHQGAIAFRGTLSDLETLSGSVWDGIERCRAQIDRLIADNQDIYQRYLALRNAMGYYETETPSVYATPFLAPVELRRLFLSNFALRMKSGNRAKQAAALADMAGDLKVWRIMLTGDGSLISKMVAVASLHADFLLIGDMIADRQLDLSHWKNELDALTTPFAIGDWQIGSAIPREVRITTRMFDALNDDQEWLLDDNDQEESRSVWRRLANRASNHFFQKQATENRDARAKARLMKILNDSPSSLVESVHAEDRSPEFSFGLDYLYNPVGKVLVAIGLSAYLDYGLRAYDVAAVQRMLRLAYEVRFRQISVGEVHGFQSSQPEWARHPVSGEVFDFDSGTGRLSLKPVGPRPEGRRFNLPVWR